MAKIIFTVPAVAALYETDFENDPFIEVGCECNNGQGYRGYLSGVGILAAQALVDQHSNQIRLKPQNGKAKEAKDDKPAITK